MSEYKDLLNQAWTLAKTVYADGDEHRFMENPQPSSLGVTNDPVRRFLSPVELIEQDGQEGFNKVMAYLRTRKRVVEPA